MLLCMYSFEGNALPEMVVLKRIGVFCMWFIEKRSLKNNNCRKPVIESDKREENTFVTLIHI